MTRVPGWVARPADVARELGAMSERERETRVHTALRKRAADEGVFVGMAVPSVTGLQPDGYVRADGQGITTDHPDLRDALIAAGSPHGTDGSGNPCVPNLNAGRFPRGAAAPGGVGGATFHAHNLTGNTGANGGIGIRVAISPNPGDPFVASQGHAHPNGGVADLQNHLPPHVDVVWFVKA